MQSPTITSYVAPGASLFAIHCIHSDGGGNIILIANVESAVHILTPAISDGKKKQCLPSDSELHAIPQFCETSLVIVLVCNEAYPSIRLIKHDTCAPPFTPSLHTLLWCLYYDTPAAHSILKWTMIVGHMSTAVEFCCVCTVCPVYTHLVVGLIFS